MNEEQTKHDKITPALKEAGWDRAPFKQIIGRGTRLCDGKPYFTIYDFTDATS